MVITLVILVTYGGSIIYSNNKLNEYKEDMKEKLVRIEQTRLDLETKRFLEEKRKEHDAEIAAKKLEDQKKKEAEELAKQKAIEDQRIAEENAKKAEEARLAQIEIDRKNEETRLANEKHEAEQAAQIKAAQDAANQQQQNININVTFQEGNIPNQSAKEWIAYHESRGDYNARNGQYVGRYQLDDDYLNGDHSPENQEAVAEKYVMERYGSWEAAKEFWIANNYY